MTPSPPDTTTTTFVLRQAKQVQQQSQHLHLCVQQVQCQVQKTWEVSNQLRQRASEQRVRSRQLCHDISYARQHLHTLLDRQLLASAPSRSSACVKRLSRQKLDDLALIERCKAGDCSAWNELIRRFERLIFSYARSLCNNDADASDITAEVYVRLFNRLHTFRRGATDFTSWLLRIVHNTYVDVCIRDSDHGHLSLEESADCYAVVDTAPSPEMLCLDKDQLRRLTDGIHRLPPYQRQILLLYMKGRSYEQIAEETSVSMGTVKSRLNRARTMLWERLEQEERLPEPSQVGNRHVLRPA